MRALTRIATPATENDLLVVALHGTVGHLENLVRATRSVTDPRPAADRRGLYWSSAEDGSLLVRLRLPVDQGHQLLAAVEARLAEHDAEHDPAEHDADSGASDADSGASDDPDDLHPFGGGSAEPHPPEPEAPPGPARDPLAARRLDALLELATGAVTTSTNLLVHLRADDDLLPTPAATPEPGASEPPAPATAPTETPAAGSQIATSNTDPAPRLRAWIDGGPDLPLTVAARLTCTAAVQALLVDRENNPLYLGRRRRTVTPAQLCALRVRDHGRCVVPGCEATRYLQAHHVVWWRFGGPTDLDNLALLCRHHHTLIHDHGYRLSPATTGSGFDFARPDGTPVPRTGTPTSGNADDLCADQLDLHIDDWTITPDWGGEPLDLDLAVAALLPELTATPAPA